jgi:hypothetical protein
MPAFYTRERELGPSRFLYWNTVIPRNPHGLSITLSSLLPARFFIPNKFYRLGAAERRPLSIFRTRDLERLVPDMLGLVHRGLTADYGPGAEWRPQPAAPAGAVFMWNSRRGIRTPVICRSLARSMYFAPPPSAKFKRRGGLTQLAVLRVCIHW